MFIVSLVPLQLSCSNNSGKKVIVWKNIKYSSTRFCRPVQFQFAKETPEKTRATVQEINNEIEHLQNSTVLIAEEKEIAIKHSLILSMIDGKVHFLCKQIKIVGI